MTKKRLARMLRTLIKWSKEMYADYPDELKDEHRHYISLHVREDEAGAAAFITWHCKKERTEDGSLSYNDAYLVGGRLHVQSSDEQME